MSPGPTCYILWPQAFIISFWTLISPSSLSISHHWHPNFQPSSPKCNLHSYPNGLLELLRSQICQKNHHPVPLAAENSSLHLPLQILVPIYFKLHQHKSYKFPLLSLAIPLLSIFVHTMVHPVYWPHALNIFMLPIPISPSSFHLRIIF